LTVKELVNAFLNEKQSAVDSGELSAFTFRDYKTATDLIIAGLGKRRLVTDLDPSDFAKMRRTMTKKWGIHRIAKIVQCIRSVFRFGIENGMIEKVVQFGTGFKKPNKRTFRIAKAKKGEKLFTPEEIKSMLGAATVSLRAMILLGVNCGFGNGDCATLPFRAIDLETGWIDFPRPKTGLARRCPLWPETITAIKDWLAVRPQPKDNAHDELVFITATGGSWSKETSDNPISKETSKLLKKLNINRHRNFYALRHTHRTISDEACDQRASAFIMGHVDASMASLYVERISDARLQAVSNHIHAWLFNRGNNP
jgi:integrase